MKKATYKQRLTRWLCKGRRKVDVDQRDSAGRDYTIYSVNHQRVYAYTLSMMEVNHGA